MPTVANPNAPVFVGGSSRPNIRFRELCDLAGIKPKTEVETGADKPWVLKDLWKTCATSSATNGTPWKSSRGESAVGRFQCPHLGGSPIRPAVCSIEAS